MKKRSLDSVAEFIRSVHAHRERGVNEQHSGTVVVASGKSLVLDDQQHRLYDAAVDQLLQDFVAAGDLSRRSVEQHLMEALGHALALSEESAAPFEARLLSAITRLQSHLSGPVFSYRCFVPVIGFSKDDLPISFGGLRFTKFGRHHERTLIKPVTRKRNHAFRRAVRHLRETDLWDSPCAVVSVKARDFAVASERAKAITRAALDCMNFFNDVIPYNHGWLYLPSEGARALEVVPMIGSDGAVSLPHTAVGPIGPFVVANVQKYPVVARHWAAVSTLLRTNVVKSTGDTLLTAIRWAGRASIEPKREEAFLLLAIALETALLPIHDVELTYRLALRASELLGGTRVQRLENRRIIRDSYSVRSKIVHSGSYEVTDDRLGRLRWMTKRVLLRLVIKKHLWAKTSKHFDDWLEGFTVR